MTTNLGLTIALKASLEDNMMDPLLEMFAFEQANGMPKPESLFYRYSLTEDQMQHCNKYRLIVKKPDGRMCLSFLGRNLVRSH